VFQASASSVVIGAGVGKGAKHHYIPVFYLKQWAGTDGRVCEFSRPYREVKPRRVHPDGTAYVRGLYTVPGVKPHLAEYIEQRFLLKSDSTASDALRFMLSGDRVEWPNTPRSSWSRFIISLMLRNPEFISQHGAQVAAYFSPNSREIQDYYRNHRTADHPETYEEFLAKNEHPAARASATSLQSQIDHPEVGTHLNKMRWSLVTFTDMRHSFLTSDRPIIMSNGLLKKHDHLVIPITPSKLFVATNNDETNALIKNMSERDLIRQVNHRVAIQARKFVYGIDDSQLRFVEKRLGKMEPSTPLEYPKAESATGGGPVGVFCTKDSWAALDD
jgi:hypothetical protein